MSKIFKSLDYDVDLVMQPGDPVTSPNGDARIRADNSGKGFIETYGDVIDHYYDVTVDIPQVSGASARVRLKNVDNTTIDVEILSIDGFPGASIDSSDPWQIQVNGSDWGVIQCSPAWETSTYPDYAIIPIGYGGRIYVEVDGNFCHWSELEQSKELLSSKEISTSSDIAITELPVSDWTVTTTTSSSQWSELYLVAGTTGWLPYGRQMDTCGEPKGDENSTSLSWTQELDAAFNITATRSAGADWSIAPSNVVLVFDNGMWCPKTIVEMLIGMEKGTADSTRIEWDSNEANIDILAVREPARYILGPDSADNPNRNKPFAKAGDYALKSDLPDVADPSDSSPLRDGTASAGTMKTYARGDHRHPTDTTRIARAGDTSLTGDFKTTGAVTVGSLATISDFSVGEFTASSHIVLTSEGVISLKNGGVTTLLAIPGGQQAANPTNTFPVLATTDHVPNKVKSQNGATFIQPNNDGTATILYSDPNATYGPPVITFSNDFSYGTMSSYAGTTVTMEGPYTVETTWTAWVKAGESAPTTIGDLMSREFAVASPGTSVGFMFFNEGTDFASIQNFESQSPTVSFYNPASGSATMTRSVSGSVVKTIATVDQIPAGYSIEHIPDGATQYVLQSNAITMVYVANITSNSLQLVLPDIDENTILTFELWLTVPSGATGSVSYLHGGNSIAPEAIGSLSLSTGFKNKLVLRLINDSGTYSLEENVYFQKGL